MKLIEALKRLRTIEKQIGKRNCEDITKYASMSSNEKPYFETADKQRAEVKAMVQSSMDLINEYMKLKRNIDYTNLITKITLQGKEYTLVDALIIKRKMYALALKVYQSLNDASGQQRLGTMRMASSEGKTITIERYYKEEDRNNGLKYWHSLLEEFDSKLEVINATTELLEFKA